MKSPKYLVLDADLAIIGMAGSFADLQAAFGNTQRTDVTFYRCMDFIPEDPSSSLSKLIKLVSAHEHEIDPANDTE